MEAQKDKKSLQGQLSRAEEKSEELLRKLYEKDDQVMAGQREAQSWKARAERESFQLKLKEEVVAQLREQQRKSEERFKQEIDK